MVCPVDGMELRMSDKQGIEIDYCPKCRGIWLDRGELDKIIERTEGEPSREYDRAQPPVQHRNRRNHRNDDDEEGGGFLSNIFGGFGGDD